MTTGFETYLHSDLRKARRAEARSFAGFRSASIARSTGTLVLVLDGEPAGLDTEGGRWQTICDDHGGICSHDTLALASSFASAPEQFCESCADQFYAEPQRNDEGRLVIRLGGSR